MIQEGMNTAIGGYLDICKKAYNEKDHETFKQGEALIIVAFTIAAIYFREQDVIEALNAYGDATDDPWLEPIYEVLGILEKGA